MKRLLTFVLVVAIGFTAIATATSSEERNKYFEIIKNIEIFTNLYKMLNTHYVDEIDPGSLMRIGLESMVGSLDPYTNYISESDIEGYRIERQGNYIGIGAVSEEINGKITVTQLFKDQAADKAGLKVGDQIIGVNGQKVEGKSEEEVNDILTGLPGTDVSIEILRPGKSGAQSFNLKRGQVDIPNVPYYGMVDDEIGYVILTTFTQNAARNIRNAIRSLQKENENLKGIVLDLRDNGGGLLIEAVNICNLFIPEGEIVVTTKSKVQERDQAFRTQERPSFEDLPVAVLVNNNSASASEIVSGVLQDYDRGVLVGQRTYGKGLVQNTHDIGYNARVKITIAKYYIPSGRCIQSVQYKDGEPLDIPDDQRAPFKTVNSGRIVRDGGGVKPDIVMPNPLNPPVIQALKDQHLIFDFVTQYCANLESIPPVDEYAFNDYEQFKAYVAKQGFEYETETEKMLSKVKETADKEGQQIEQDLMAIQKQIDEAKAVALNDHKQLIVNLIELEIANRYYYERGKTQMNLKQDPVLDRAILALNDKAEYQSILSGQ